VIQSPCLQENNSISVQSSMAAAVAVTEQPAAASLPDHSTHSRVHARIGLLGNPSDGYNGKTISFSLANFYAEVLFRNHQHRDTTQQRSNCTA
jgi:hypothetical protein